MAFKRVPLWLLLLLSSHVLYALKYISRYVCKHAPAGVTTGEWPHILPTAVHALAFYREKGSALPFPRRR